MLSEDDLQHLEQLKKQYPTTKSLTLPLLWMIQEREGWISPEAMKQAAGLLGLPVSHIYGVATFYTMFNTRPVGEHHLQVCTNVSCMLRGADELLGHVCRRLGIQAGETTPDRKFTVSPVECLGSCGSAPALQVSNGDYHENLSAAAIDALIDRLSEEKRT